jgi:hypothetical protein
MQGNDFVTSQSALDQLQPGVFVDVVMDWAVMTRVADLDEVAQCRHRYRIPRPQPAMAILESFPACSPVARIPCLKGGCGGRKPSPLKPRRACRGVPSPRFGQLILSCRKATAKENFTDGDIGP